MQDISNETNVAPSLSDEILAAHCPVLYLHHHDAYRPVSIEWFIERAQLNYYPSGVTGTAEVHELDKVPGGVERLIPTGKVTQEKLLEAQASCPHPGNLSLTVGPEHYGGSSCDQLSDVPIYAHAKLVVNDDGRPEAYEINYVTFYAYNGQYHLPANVPLFRTGHHVGDWEHLTVRLGATSLELQGVWYNAHRNIEGEWCPARDVPRTPCGRIVGYVAINGHGIYPHCGTIPRLFFVANDRTSRRGPVWCTTRLVRLCGLPHGSGCPVVRSRGCSLPHTPVQRSAATSAHPTNTETGQPPAPPDPDQDPDPSPVPSTDPGGVGSVSDAVAPPGCSTDVSDRVGTSGPQLEAGGPGGATGEESACCPAEAAESHTRGGGVSATQAPGSEAQRVGTCGEAQQRTESVGVPIALPPSPSVSSPSAAAAIAAAASTATRASTALPLPSAQGPNPAASPAVASPPSSSHPTEPTAAGRAGQSAAAGLTGCADSGVASDDGGDDEAGCGAGCGNGGAPAPPDFVGPPSGERHGEFPLPAVVHDTSPWQRYRGFWGSVVSATEQGWFQGPEPPVSRGLVRRLFLPLARGVTRLEPAKKAAEASGSGASVLRRLAGRLAR